MRGGRARWQIENETFNTLKNQGYEMGHNYGHGHQDLCSNLGLLMLLAFLIDQLSELSDKSFQQAKEPAKSYRVLWEELWAIFKFFILESFEGLYLKILPEHRYNSS
ncbi:MAG: hypothetical protein I8H75_03470 [Myxococcaceae bacterium]|nr:hypothetical protein [Myxococcaceae bacterium]